MNIIEIKVVHIRILPDFNLIRQYLSEALDLFLW